MKIIHNLADLITPEKIVRIYLFVYFGFIIFPQWANIYSPYFLIWLVILPIILLIFLIIGVEGGIGLWRAKLQNAPYNPKHKYYLRLVGISLLWFGISIMLSYGTQYIYNHKNFNSEIWKHPNEAGYTLYDSIPSIRQRMVNDVVENILPGSTRKEIESSLGSPYESWNSDGTEYILYILGPERGLGVDSECLFIEYDVEGNFQKYNVSGNCG